MDTDTQSQSLIYFMYAISVISCVVGIILIATRPEETTVNKSVRQRHLYIGIACIFIGVVIASLSYLKNNKKDSDTESNLLSTSDQQASLYYF